MYDNPPILTHYMHTTLDFLLTNHLHYLKSLMQDIYCQETDQFLLTTKEIYYGITLLPKKYHFYMFLKIKNALKQSQFSTKIEYILLIHCPAELIFGIQQSM